MLGEGWYFKFVSTTAGATASQTPTYPTHHIKCFNVKLQ